MGAFYFSVGKELNQEHHEDFILYKAYKAQ